MVKLINNNKKTYVPVENEMKMETYQTIYFIFISFIQILYTTRTRSENRQDRLGFG